MTRVLLIESNQVLADTIARYLESHRLVVDVAKEPQAAITKADANRPDVVLLDLLLAERSGIEFLYEFVSYPDWQGVPVVLLSSVPEHEVNIAGEGFAQCNIHKFIYKPQANLASIYEAVKYCLSLQPR